MPTLSGNGRPLRRRNSSAPDSGAATAVRCCCNGKLVATQARRHIAGAKHALEHLRRIDQHAITTIMAKAVIVPRQVIQIGIQQQASPLTPPCRQQLAFGQ